MEGMEVEGHHLLQMEVADCAGDFCGVKASAGEREGAFLEEAIVEVPTGHVVKGHVELVVALEGVVHADKAWVGGHAQEGVLCERPRSLLDDRILSPTASDFAQLILTLS